MNQNPLVTIICSCFNHEKFVIETIKSVQNQSYSNIEIIIIDDCSLDNSVSIISDYLNNYPEIRFIQNKQNLGNTKTFNKAAKIANGAFLIDLACDDILLSNCVEIQIETYLKLDRNTTGIVFGNSENIDDKGNYISDYFPTDSNKNVIDKNLFQTNLIQLLKGGLVMNSVSAMINKSIFNELNGYDESLAFEDLDFWVRVLEKYQIVFIDEIITQKRDLKTSLGSQLLIKTELSIEMNKSMNLIFSKVINNHKKNKTVLKAVLKRVHYSLIHSIKSKRISLIFDYGMQKLKIHYLVLFAK